jgi:hypothetical protein
MSYYGQLPFNTNGGALLSKRNYINRKLDEIEQKLLQLGWIEPEEEFTEEITNEYDMPVESAGALIPYRDKVNKRLDFFEEVINSHVGQSYDSNDYNGNYDNSYYNNSNDYYTNPQPQTYNRPTQPIYSNPQPQTYTKPQEEVKKAFEDVVFRKMS